MPPVPQQLFANTSGSGAGAGGAVAGNAANVYADNIGGNGTIGGNGATINGDNNQLFANSGGTLDLNGNVSVVGGLTKSGSGTLVLKSANSYAGATMVNAGTVVLSGNNSFSGGTTLNGGTLAANNGEVAQGPASGNNRATLGNNSGVLVNNATPGYVNNATFNNGAPEQRHSELLAKEMAKFDLTAAERIKTVESITGPERKEWNPISRENIANINGALQANGANAFGSVNVAPEGNTAYAKGDEAKHRGYFQNGVSLAFDNATTINAPVAANAGNAVGISSYNYTITKEDKSAAPTGEIESRRGGFASAATGANLGTDRNYANWAEGESQQLQQGQMNNAIVSGNKLVPLRTELPKPVLHGTPVALPSSVVIVQKEAQQINERLSEATAAPDSSRVTDAEKHVWYALGNEKKLTADEGRKTEEMARGLRVTGGTSLSLVQPTGGRADQQRQDAGLSIGGGVQLASGGVLSLGTEAAGEEKSKSETRRAGASAYRRELARDKVAADAGGLQAASDIAPATPAVAVATPVVPSLNAWASEGTVAAAAPAKAPAGWAAAAGDQQLDTGKLADAKEAAKGLVLLGSGALVMDNNDGIATKRKEAAGRKFVIADDRNKDQIALGDLSGKDSDGGRRASHATDLPARARLAKGVQASEESEQTRRLTTATTEGLEKAAPATPAEPTPTKPVADGAERGPTDLGFGGRDAADPSALDMASTIKSPLILKGIAKGYGGRFGRGGVGRDNAVDSGIMRALRYLKENQNPDGTWNHQQPETTSLALLSFLAFGKTTADAEFGSTVERALTYLRQTQKNDGRFSAQPDENAVATWAICEAYGMTRIPDLQATMDKAIAAMVSEGNPQDARALVLRVQALKAALLAGSESKDIKDAMARTLEPLRNNAHAETALGLQQLGYGKDQTTLGKLRQMSDEKFSYDDPRPLANWVLLSQARFHESKESFAMWKAKAFPEILKMQTPAGNWPARAPAQGMPESESKATALAALTLETTVRFLPSYQHVEDEPIVEAKPTKPVFRAAAINPWMAVSDQSFSTFSISVDSASFTLARRYLNGGQRPPPESVRTEEFVNYFDFAYAPPGRDLFSVHAQAARTPFCPPGVHLLKLGIKGKQLGRENRGANLTFLLDNSGSMNAPDRLDLARAALKLLVEKLGPADRVALITFSSRARLVLDFTPATEQKKILAALDGIQAAGFTHLEGGLKLAYQTAARGFVSGAANRVILMSDGVANVGADETAELLAQVEQYRKQNIFCSVFGLGTGTYDDTMLQALASKGNGTYLFMDSLDEARRVFVDELAATLNKVAADVKIQVEFNPRRVKQYRQLGYEQRQLKTEDFRNDAVAAAEVGSGQSVTALYQIELQGDATEPLGTVRVRGRNLETGRVEELERAIEASDLAPSFEQADVRFRLAAAAAQFAEILRGSSYAEGSTCADVAKVLRPLALELNLDQKVQELLRLVNAAASAPQAAE